MNNLLQAPAPAQPTGSSTAQPTPQGPMGGCAGASNPMFPMVLVFVVFYFMLIRPQQKKQRETQDWLKQLKKGDEVVTSGGIIGRISLLADDVITLELADKVRIRVVRSHITGPAPSPKPAADSTPETKTT